MWGGHSQKRANQIRTWRQTGRSIKFILPNLSHPEVVSINYIRQERNAHSEPDSSPANTAPKAFDEIVLLPPFAGNMDNIEIPNFNCLKRRWSAGRAGLDFALGKSPVWLNQHKGEMKKNGLQERIPWHFFMHIKSNTDKFHPYLTPEVAQLQAALFLGWNSWVCPKNTIGTLLAQDTKQTQGKTVACFPVGMWHELNCTVLLWKLV